jgi:hypothetical protein
MYFFTQKDFLPFFTQKDFSAFPSLKSTSCFSSLEKAFTNTQSTSTDIFEQLQQV